MLFDFIYPNVLIITISKSKQRIGIYYRFENEGIRFSKTRFSRKNVFRLHEMRFSVIFK